MLLKRDQEEWLGKLEIGYGVAKIGETENPFMIKIPKFDIRKGVVTDHDLSREFRRRKGRQNEDSQTPPTPEEGTAN